MDFVAAVNKYQLLLYNIQVPCGLAIKNNEYLPSDTIVPGPFDLGL